MPRSAIADRLDGETGTPRSAADGFSQVLSRNYHTICWIGSSSPESHLGSLLHLHQHRHSADVCSASPAAKYRNAVPTVMQGRSVSPANRRNAPNQDLRTSTCGTWARGQMVAHCRCHRPRRAGLERDEPRPAPATGQALHRGASPTALLSEIQHRRRNMPQSPPAAASR